MATGKGFVPHVGLAFTENEKSPAQIKDKIKMLK
jgi:hypothetical protein